MKEMYGSTHDPGASRNSVKAGILHYTWSAMIPLSPSVVLLWLAFLPSVAKCALDDTYPLRKIQTKATGTQTKSLVAILGTRQIG